MRVERMIIKDEHIKHAEEIFIRGYTFDQEQRVPFIKNLDTCDLLAVPGSGKTTALMAKLYCIAQLMPFEDGSGILVLAHTNAAIEEIEKNLKKYCPALFQYPNYVGTVQSFVNKFLANPANFHKYGSYLHRVDNEIANDNIEKNIESLNSNLKNYLFFQSYGLYARITISKLINSGNFSPKEAASYIQELKLKKIITNDGSLVYHEVHECRKLNIPDKLKSLVFAVHKEAKDEASKEQCKRGTKYYPDFIRKKFDSDMRSLKFTSPSGATLLRIIENNLSVGIARYRDCYCLGRWYITTFQDVVTILQKRFKYVFVDETQDLESYQLDIIDDIFFTVGSSSIIQRVGDINQSIYNSSKKVKVECDWKSRETQFPGKYTDLYLTGSNRLTATNAQLVNCFTLDPRDGLFNVEGERVLEQDDIEPHLILFDEKTSGEELKEKFYEIIQKYRLENTIEGKKYGFKIIGWSARWENDKRTAEKKQSKLRLEDIFTYYKKEKNSKKENLDSLSKYLQFYNEADNTLRLIRDSILSALVLILRLEDKKREILVRGAKKERLYTKQDLINFIKDSNNSINYNDFKARLLEWCFDVACRKKSSSAYHSIKQFIETEFKIWFGLELRDGTQEFIGQEFVDFGPSVLIEDKDKDNNPADNIEICTVHSAKGQTHCATMYVETSYYEYESRKLIEIEQRETKTRNAVLKPNPLFYRMQNYSGVKKKEAVKMMYVGFSRPTHLLCFAALKDNVISDLDQFEKAGWKIVCDLVDL